MYSLECNLLLAKLFMSSIKNESGRKNVFYFFLFSLDYVSVGCYKDTSNTAIQIIDGTDSIVSYSFRSNFIAKCAVAAMRAGYSMFAVQNGGQCTADATAPQTFDKYGKSTACNANGEGGPSANQVYLIKG